MKRNSQIITLFLVSACLLSACQPVEPVKPEETASTSMRIIPTQATSISHTATPTPDPSAAQLAALQQASLAYLADSDAASWEVAKSLGYAPLGGYPSNMCGPLAVAILRDAGLVSQSVDLHDFWLLDPAIDGDLLSATFPEEHFARFRLEDPINKIDYSLNPLKAGDFVYIYSGYRGDYSHVLAVTRVDESGRAYSVTNNYTEAGFLIEEYLLYDPADPTAGMFSAWTNPANRALGLTGFSGLEVWRPLSLPYFADPLP